MTNQTDSLGLAGKTPEACPFCGGAAKCNELRRGNYKRVGDNYQVVCNKCRSRGPLVQDNPATAIARWNVFAKSERELVEALDYSHQSEVQMAGQVAQLTEALEVFQSFGCPVCNGDCASANPPVLACPMLMASRAISSTKATGENP